VNIALPAIGRDLHASVAGLQWTVDGYALVLASPADALRCEPPTGSAAARVFQVGPGHLHRRFPRCAAWRPAWAGWSAFRMLQAIGGSMLNPGGDVHHHQHCSTNKTEAGPGPSASGAGRRTACPCRSGRSSAGCSSTPSAGGAPFLREHPDRPGRDRAWTARFRAGSRGPRAAAPAGPGGGRRSSSSCSARSTYAIIEGSRVRLARAGPSWRCFAVAAAALGVFRGLRGAPHRAGARPQVSSASGARSPARC